MRAIIRFIVVMAITTVYWSAIRLANFTIFDIMTPIVLIFSWLAPQNTKYKTDGDLKYVWTSQIFFILAVAPSAFMTTDMVGHIAKWSIIETAMLGMILSLALMKRRQILSYDGIRYCLCVSATTCSIVVILQGAFQLFRWLSPSLDDALSWGDLLRPTGLSEHPIEASSVAAIGAILCMSLLLSRRRHRMPQVVDIVLFIMFLLNCFSFKYSASLTAVFGFSVGTIILLLFSGKIKTLIASVAAAFLVIIIAASSPSSLLTDRVSKFLSSGSNYTTVQTRTEQISDTLDRIDFVSFFLGHGYSEKDLPDGKEIHNALIASDYHFGIFGLLSQIFLMTFICVKITSPYDKVHRALLGAIFIIFLSEYLTGPVFARRSDWICLLALAIYMPKTQGSAIKRQTLRARRYAVSALSQDQIATRSRNHRNKLGG